MKKTLFKILLLFFIIQNSSCYDSAEIYQGSPYDPSMPVVISGFSPDSGGIRTQVVVKGENFGTDMSNIKFYFGEKEAQLMGVKGEAAYLLMPKQPGDLSNLSVVIDGDSIVFEKKQFKYEISASVSTLVGKAKERGQVDGTLLEATFNNIGFMNIDGNGNIFVSEYTNQRFRMISISAGRVITLRSGQMTGLATPSPDGRVMYGLATEGGVLTLFDPLTQWVPEPKGRVSPAAQTDWFQSFVTSTEIDGFFITRGGQGKILKAPLGVFNSEDVVTISETQFPGDPQQNLFAYNDGYFYLALTGACQIWRAKAYANGNIDEFTHYAGSTRGYADGFLDDCKFNDPGSMCFDSENNMFVADKLNHVIRKITPEGIVETIAGIPGQAGYKDGDPIGFALFDRPHSVAIDQDEFLYVAEQNNQCIRKIAIE